MKPEPPPIKSAPGKENEAAANFELVQEMGSPNGYDPIPPSQYLYFLDSEDGVQRLLAWVRSKTIRKGYRSPFAISKKGGRPLTKADLAKQCFDGDRGNTWRAWDRAEAMGLVHEDGKGFLYLSGNVKRDYRRRNGEPLLSVQTICPSYLLEKIKLLPEELRNAAERDFGAFFAFRAKVYADTIGLVRIRCDQIEDNISRKYFGEHGKRRLNKKHRPDLRKDNGSQAVELELLALPQDLAPFAPSEIVCADNGNAVCADNANSLCRQPAEVPPEPDSRAFEASGSQRAFVTPTEEAPLSESVRAYRGRSSSSSSPSAPSSAGQLVPENSLVAAPLAANPVPHLRADATEKPNPLPKGSDDFPTQTSEFASAREELKAVYKAKTGELPQVRVWDRIETVLLSNGQSWDSMLQELKAGHHLLGTWESPPAFLTHFARGVGKQMNVSPPGRKALPRCVLCQSDKRRGVIMVDGQIVVCPKCSTPEWLKEWGAKEAERVAKRQGGSHA